MHHLHISGFAVLLIVFAIMALLFGLGWFILALREQNSERRRWSEARPTAQRGPWGDPWSGAAYAPRRRRRHPARLLPQLRSPSTQPLLPRPLCITSTTAPPPATCWSPAWPVR